MSADVKLPRVIRLDESDTHIFEAPAAPGEWAVPGGFAFADVDPDDLSGVDLIAFGQTFLGLSSFGRATLVQVTDATPAAVETATEALARHFVDRWGAPDIDAARPVAADEIAFTAELCAGHAPGQLLALEREVGDDGVIERFRAVERPRGLDHGKVWTLVPDDGKD